MKSSLFAFPLMIIGAVVLGAACTTTVGTGSGPTGGDSGGGVVTCQAETDPCDVDDDCCAFNCSAGVCDANANASCVDDGDACSADTDCCSSICDSGSCDSGVVAVTCVAEGDTCSADTDCCAYSCDTGSGTCIANTSGTCVDDNEECSADSDCCSNDCASDGYCGE